MISAQGVEIVKLCEAKVRLQTRAEYLSDEARRVLDLLKQISNEQYTILQNMKDIDAKICYLSQRI